MIAYSKTASRSSRAPVARTRPNGRTFPHRRTRARNSVAELDTIEKSTPDLERQLRAAVIALGGLRKKKPKRAPRTSPDNEQRERIELRSKAHVDHVFHERGTRPAGRWRGGGIAGGVWYQRPRDSARTVGRSDMSAATAKASAKHARSLRRPEQPESISIRFARPCLPTASRRAWESKCRV